MSDKLLIEDWMYEKQELISKIDFNQKYISELEADNTKLKVENERLRTFLADSIAQGKTQR